MLINSPCIAGNAEWVAMEMMVVRKSRFSGNSVMASYRAGSLRNVWTTFNNGVMLENKQTKLFPVRICVKCTFN